MHKDTCLNCSPGEEVVHDSCEEEEDSDCCSSDEEEQEDSSDYCKGTNKGRLLTCVCVCVDLVIVCV